jgi:hypothetical protein
VPGAAGEQQCLLSGFIITKLREGDAWPSVVSGELKYKFSRLFFSFSAPAAARFALFHPLHSATTKKGKKKRKRKKKNTGMNDKAKEIETHIHK